MSTIRCRDEISARALSVRSSAHVVGNGRGAWKQASLKHPGKYQPGGRTARARLWRGGAACLWIVLLPGLRGLAASCSVVAALAAMIPYLGNTSRDSAGTGGEGDL